LCERLAGADAWRTGGVRRRRFRRRERPAVGAVFAEDAGAEAAARGYLRIADEQAVARVRCVVLAALVVCF
jgi:hypothetical protein